MYSGVEHISQLPRCVVVFICAADAPSADQVSHQIEQRAEHAAINAGAIRCCAFFVARSVGRSFAEAVCSCKVPAEKQKSGSNLFKLPAGKENKHSAQWIQQTVKQLTCP